MTREQAHRVLDVVRRGRYVPEQTILEALHATGDLPQPMKPRKRRCMAAGAWRTA